MKAYKDLEKSQECEDGDPVAVAVFDESEFTQPDVALRPTAHSLDILDAEYITGE